MKHQIIIILLLSCLTTFGQTEKADSLMSTDNFQSEPEFPGGEYAMYKFMNDRLVIEPGDLGEHRQTKIYIGFTIAENGELEDIKILRGINEKIDSSVVQMFEEMPTWTPAYLNGKPVRHSYTMPIRLEFK